MILLAHEHHLLWTETIPVTVQWITDYGSGCNVEIFYYCFSTSTNYFILIKRSIDYALLILITSFIHSLQEPRSTRETAPLNSHAAESKKVPLTSKDVVDGDEQRSKWR